MFKNILFYKIFFTTSLIVLILLFLNSRIYLNKYVFEPLDVEQIEENFLTDLYQLKNDLKLSSGLKDIFYRNDFIQVSQLLHSGVARFMQNNKSYLYLYSENKNLTKKEFKKLKSIAKNVSLEGAYFLHPENLDKVMINFKYKDEKDIEILFNYFQFIIEQELNKVEKKKIIITPSPELKRNIEDIHQLVDYYLNNISQIRKQLIKKLQEAEQFKNIGNLYIDDDMNEEDYLILIKLLYQKKDDLLSDFIKNKKKLSSENLDTFKAYTEKKFNGEILLSEPIKKIIDKYEAINNMRDVITFLSFIQSISLANKNLEVINKNNLNDLFFKDIINGLVEVKHGSYSKSVYGFNINDENLEKLVKDIFFLSEVIEESDSLMLKSISNSVDLNYRSDQLLNLIKVKLKKDIFFENLKRKTKLNLKSSDEVYFSKSFVDFDKLRETYAKNIKFVNKSFNKIEILSSLIFSFVMSIMFTYLILNFGYKKNS